MAPVPFRFEPVEALQPGVASTLPATLQVATTPIYYKSLILRLLTGTIDIECKKTAIVIQQRNNYSTLTLTTSLRPSKRSLTLALPCTLAKYNTHAITTLNHNFSFYRDIYFEFCGYFFLKNNKNEVGAFVHLYRVLERISYCLPLMWAAKAADYKKTFGLLKNYFIDPKAGELAFLKRFIEDFFDITEKQTCATLNIASTHSDWRIQYYKILYELLRADRIVSSSAHSQIVIHFEVLLDLVITIRNRYFHALTGGTSFNCEEIIDPDEFFSILNENLANWLSFLIFKIFENELKRI